VLHGNNGAFAGLAADSIVLGMSTLSPGYCQGLAEEAGKIGIHVLDCPITGGVIAAANGTYILPLDADDKLHQKMITQCMSVMNKCNVDIVYVDLQQFGEKNDIRHRVAFRNNHLLYENLPPQASLYKKEVWEICDGYKQNMEEGYEDWEFWIRVSRAGWEFHLIDKELFHYRVRENSLTTAAQGENSEQIVDYVSAKNNDIIFTRYKYYFRLYGKVQERPVMFCLKLLYSKYVRRSDYPSE